jgi:hypothetical protein
MQTPLQAVLAWIARCPYSSAAIAICLFVNVVVLACFISVADQLSPLAKRTAANATLVGTWQDGKGGGANFAADGKVVLASSGRCVMATYTVDTAKKIITMTGPHGDVQKAAYSIDGDLLTMMAADGEGGMDYGVLHRKK